jgi:hypothetical protein
LGSELQFRPQFEKLYELAKAVLGDLMPSRSEEIMKACIFDKGVMVLPLPNETTKDELKSRADPSIFIVNHQGEDKIEMGLQCNTLKSVEKLRNILDSYHFREKAELLQGLSRLDGDFETVVYSKKKPYNFGQSPDYERDLVYPSSSITEKEIDRLFSRVDEIRASGIEQKIISGRRDPPELPAIGIAEVTIKKDETLFTRKLEQLKPIYVSTLNVKTRSQIKKAEKIASKLREEAKASRPPVILCLKCKGQEYSREEYNKNRGFCPKCGMRLSFLRT